MQQNNSRNNYVHKIKVNRGYKRWKERTFKFLFKNWAEIAKLTKTRMKEPTTETFLLKNWINLIIQVVSIIHCCFQNES